MDRIFKNLELRLESANKIFKGFVLFLNMHRHLAKHETFIIVGVFMTFGTLIKLFEICDFSSDWFWLIAGLGLMIEGSIALKKERLFNRKYKVVLREE